MELYRQNLPSPSEFDTQAAALRKPYEECHEIMFFAELVEVVCSDSKGLSLTMKGVDRKVREAMVHKVRGIGEEYIERACDRYEGVLAKIKFESFAMDTFEETSLDFSSKQFQKMRRLHRKGAAMKRATLSKRD